MRSSRLPLLPTLLLLIAGSGCQPEDLGGGPGNPGSEPLEITELTLEGSDHCSLVARVRWHTTVEATAAVEFGAAGIPEFVVHGETTGTDHEVVVVGMRPEEHNTLWASSISADGEVVRSEPLSFETGEVPEPWQPLTVDIHDAARARTGWTLFNVALDMYTPTFVVMVDMEGYPVWYHRLGEEEEGKGRADVIPSLIGGHVLIGPGVPTGTGPAEVDLCGEVLWEGPEQDLALGADGGYHHVFRKTAAGLYMLVELEVQGEQLGDIIVMMDDQREVVWSWNTFDHLQDHPDWIHMNSVWIDEDEETLYANSYAADRLFKIDAVSGELLWTFGATGEFAADPDATDPWPGRAHGVSVLPDGHLLLYDNGSEERAYSRVVEYEIDEAESSARIAWQYPGTLADDPWWAAAWGDADRLDNGNTLINAAAGTGTPPAAVSRTFEVTPEGEIVWQAWWSEDADVELGSAAAQRVDPLATPLIDSRPVD